MILHQLLDRPLDCAYKQTCFCHLIFVEKGKDSFNFTGGVGKSGHQGDSSDTRSRNN